MGEGGKGRIILYGLKNKKFKIHRGCTRKKLEARFIKALKKSYK